MKDPGRERIIVSSPESTTPQAVRQRQTRRRLTALGWLMLFFCLIMVLCSPNLIRSLVTLQLPTPNSINSQTPWLAMRLLRILWNFPLEILAWAFLNPNYGLFGCYLAGVTIAVLGFICLTEVFEAIGVRVFHETQ